MTPEDYLGITALALTELAELLANCIESVDTLRSEDTEILRTELN